MCETKLIERESDIAPQTCEVATVVGLAKGTTLLALCGPGLPRVDVTGELLTTSANKYSVNRQRGHANMAIAVRTKMQCNINQRS